MKTVLFTSLLLLFIIATRCTNLDVSNSSKIPEALYTDCKVWGAEDEDSVTCLFQFKPGASSAVTVVLKTPAAIQLDGEALRPDSATLSGAYYEVQKPLPAFAGTHTIVYTDNNGNKHKEEFRFTPFTLKTEMPQTISKYQNILLPIQGLKPDDIIRVVLIDTAFKTTDINQMDTLKNSVLLIRGQQLSNMASGPLVLQLFKEEEQPLKNLTPKGGHIEITYGLRRDIEMTDDR